MEDPSKLLRRINEFRKKSFELAGNDKIGNVMVKLFELLKTVVESDVEPDVLKFSVRSLSNERDTTSGADKRRTTPLRHIVYGAAETLELFTEWFMDRELKSRLKRVELEEAIDNSHRMDDTAMDAPEEEQILETIDVPFDPAVKDEIGPLHEIPQELPDDYRFTDTPSDSACLAVKQEPEDGQFPAFKDLPDGSGCDLLDEAHTVAGTTDNAAEVGAKVMENMREQPAQKPTPNDELDRLEREMDDLEREGAAELEEEKKKEERERQEKEKKKIEKEKKKDEKKTRKADKKKGKDGKKGHNEEVEAAKKDMNEFINEASSSGGSFVSANGSTLSPTTVAATAPYPPAQPTPIAASTSKRPLPTDGNDAVEQAKRACPTSAAAAAPAKPRAAPPPARAASPSIWDDDNFSSLASDNDNDDDYVVPTSRPAPPPVKKPKKPKTVKTDKRFKCRFCPIAYREKSQLNTHMKQHAGS